MGVRNILRLEAHIYLVPVRGDRVGSREGVAHIAADDEAEGRKQSWG